MTAIDTGPAWSSGMEPLFLGAPASAFQFWKAAMTLPITLTVEAMRFGSQRMKANAEHLERMLQCETPDQLLQEQSSFMTAAAKDYETEAQVFAETVRTATEAPSQAA